MAQGDFKVAVDFKDAEKAAEAVGKIGTEAKKARAETKELKGSLSGFRDVGGPIGDISSKLDDMKSRVSGAQSGFSGLASTVGGTAVAVGIATVAVAALAAAFAAVGVVKLALEIADMADALNDLSNRTNISTERLSLLDAAAKMAGSSAEELVASAEKLGTKLAKQDAETGKVVQGLKTLGVSTKDANGETKSMLQLQEEVVLAVAKAANKAEAEGAALQILGTEYYKLKTAIRETFEQKSELYDYMKNTGSLVTQKLAKDSDQLNDNISKLGLAFKGMAMSIASAVIPYLNTLLEKMIKVGEYAAGLVAKWSGNGTGSQKADWGREELQNKIAGEQTNIDGKSRGLAGMTARGRQEIEEGKQRIEGYKEQIRLLGTAKAAAITAEAKVKDAVINGAVGEGNRPSGKDHVAKAGKTANEKTDKDAEKQTKLLEQWANLYQKQTGAGDKLTDAQAERNQLLREGSVILNQVHGLGQSEKDLALANLGVQYDRTKEAEKQKKLTEEIRKEAEKHYETLNKMKVRAGEYTSKLKEEFDIRNMSKADRDDAERVRGGTASQDAQLAAYREELNKAGLSEGQRTGIQNSITEVELLKSSTIQAIEAINLARRTSENSLSEGVSRGVNSYLDSIPSKAQTIADAVNNVGKSMEDAFVNLATTGKLNIKSLAVTVLQEIARMQAKAAVSGIMKLIGGAFGGGASTGTATGADLDYMSLNYQANGGVWSRGVQMFANGGVVNRATPFGMAGGGMGVMGEAGPEAIMPLKRGADGKLGIAGANSSKGGDITSNIALTFNVSGGSDPEETARKTNEYAMKQVKGIVRQEIADQRRRGNPLNPN